MQRSSDFRFGITYLISYLLQFYQNLLLNYITRCPVLSIMFNFLQRYHEDSFYLYS